MINYAKEAEHALQNLEEDRQKSIVKIREAFPNFPNEMGPGSFAMHEAFDRLFVATDSWNGYILEHPAIVNDPEAYKDALVISQLMYRMYNQMGVRAAFPLSEK